MWKCIYVVLKILIIIYFMNGKKYYLSKCHVVLKRIYLFQKNDASIICSKFYSIK